MPELEASPHFSGLSVDLTHTMPEVVAHNARRFGGKPFCVPEGPGEAISYAAFERRVTAFGAQLLAMGIAPGDRVAIWAPNSCEWILAATAAECIGAIMIPINTRFKGLEARYVLEKARVSALFTVSTFIELDFQAMLRDATGGPGDGRPFAELPALKHVFLLDEPGFASAYPTPEDEAAYRAAAAAVTPTTTADILYTSGTTGYPKGAMHHHGQALLMAAYYNEANDLRESDRVVVVNPFFHSFGYRSGWVSGLVAGMTVYPMATFDPAALLPLIEREKITAMGGAPTAFYSMINHPDRAKYDLSSLRSGHTGGAKTPPDIIRAGYEDLGFDIFLTSYGLTEATAMISSNRPGDPLDVIQRTVGRPVKGMEVRIVDGEGVDVAPGESGELLTRGPMVMQGYFEDPEATDKALDADGWLRTGDVAMQEADGRLRILDRMKDVVIVGGFNAYPVEIEIMLAAHPAIAEVAIIGVPDERMGEVCAACVIPKQGEMLSLEQLVAWCRERMANFKVPRYLYLLNEFPRTPLGKVQKFKLRDAVHPHTVPLEIAASR